MEKKSPLTPNGKYSVALNTLLSSVTSLFTLVLTLLRQQILWVLVPHLPFRNIHNYVIIHLLGLSADTGPTLTIHVQLEACCFPAVSPCISLIYCAVIVPNNNLIPNECSRSSSHSRHVSPSQQFLNKDERNSIITTIINAKKKMASGFLLVPSSFEWFLTVLQQSFNLEVLHCIIYVK